MLKEWIIPQERILNRIIVLREEKVMLDFHLAELYGVENRALKQAVRRNIDLFPDDFMFVLTKEEKDFVVSKSLVSSQHHFGGANPFAFTETVIAMLSSVLKSKRAKEMNVTIMRTFVAIRKLALDYAEIMEELEGIRKKVSGQSQQIGMIFDYLKKYEQLKQSEIEQQNRKRIGFNLKNKTS